MTNEADLWGLVTAGQQGILATVARDGRPQLSNVLYVLDPDARVARMSTTADRVKARSLSRIPAPRCMCLATASGSTPSRREPPACPRSLRYLAMKPAVAG